MAQNPLTGGMYSPYASILGVPQDVAAPQEAPQGAPNMVADIMGFTEPTQEQPSESPMADAPVVQIVKAKETAKAEAKADAERKGKVIEKQNAAPVFDRSIARMMEINEELKKLNAIPSEEQAPVDRAGAQIKGSFIGQKASTVADPKAQALREEYRKLKNSILPAYKKAAGLTAGEGNTETEQENIKSGFGDESGFYEANKRLLEEMQNKYGSPKKSEAPNQASPTAPPAKPKGLKVWNPNTRKFEMR
jgi:hypothetical protein